MALGVKPAARPQVPDMQQVAGAVAGMGIVSDPRRRQVPPGDHYQRREAEESDEEFAHVLRLPLEAQPGNFRVRRQENSAMEMPLANLAS